MYICVKSSLGVCLNSFLPDFQHFENHGVISKLVNIPIFAKGEVRHSEASENS